MFLASPFVYKKVSSYDALCQTQCFCKMRYFLSSLLECFVLWSELISCFSMQFSPFYSVLIFWGSFYAFKGITSFLFYTHNMEDSKASHIRKKREGKSPLLHRCKRSCLSHNKIPNIRCFIYFSIYVCFP